MITVGLLIIRDAGQQTQIITAVDPAPAPAFDVPYEQVTGLSQYRAAEAAALAWASDARLIFASATWPRLMSVTQVGQPGEWVYHFYSAAKARKLFVSVLVDNQVQTIQHVVPVSLPPRTVSTEAWLIDSPFALEIWLDRGGAEAIRNNPETEVVAQLRQVRGSRNPVWMVVGLNTQTNATHSVIVDASNGRVLR